MALLNFWNSLGVNIRRVTLPAHILTLVGIASVFTGDTNWFWLMIIYPAWFLFGHIGYGIFVHRYFCHRSFQTYTWIARLGAFFGLLSGAGSAMNVKVLHVGLHHPHRYRIGPAYTHKRSLVELSIMAEPQS